MTKTMSKNKKSILDGYKTYDTSNGYGSSREWRDGFRSRMGYEEATVVIGGDSPFAVLGISETNDWKIIKSAFRRLAMKYHPDICKDEDSTKRMQAINAAYTVLERKFGM